MTFAFHAGSCFTMMSLSVAGLHAKPVGTFSCTTIGGSVNPVWFQVVKTNPIFEVKNGITKFFGVTCEITVGAGVAVTVGASPKTYLL